MPTKRLHRDLPGFIESLKALPPMTGRLFVSAALVVGRIIRRGRSGLLFDGAGVRVALVIRFLRLRGFGRAGRSQLVAIGLLYGHHLTVGDTRSSMALLRPSQDR
jgi:hypothetical protein